MNNKQRTTHSVNTCVKAEKTDSKHEQLQTNETMKQRTHTEHRHTHTDHSWMASSVSWQAACKECRAAQCVFECKRKTQTYAFPFLNINQRSISLTYEPRIKNDQSLLVMFLNWTHHIKVSLDYEKQLTFARNVTTRTPTTSISARILRINIADDLDLSQIQKIVISINTAFQSALIKNSSMKNLLKAILAIATNEDQWFVREKIFSDLSIYWRNRTFSGKLWLEIQ